MLIYYLLLAGSIGLGLVLNRNKFKHGKLFYCIIIGIALFVISAIRSHVGYDYNMYATRFYEMNFSSLDKLSHSERMEKGFIIPIKLLSDLFISYQPMFVAVAFIIAAGVTIYLYRGSEKPWIGVTAFLMLGLYFNSMNFLRQFVAAIVVMYALKYIQKNQFMRYAALILLATCFHISAFIMIPFFFILKIKMEWITLGIYTAILTVSLVFSYPIINLITQYIYKGYDLETNVEIMNGLPIGYTIGFLVFFLLAFLFRKPLVAKNPFHVISINCLYFTVFFEAIGIKHGVVSRFAILFYLVPALVLAPDMVMIILEKTRKFFSGSKVQKTASFAVVSIMLVLSGTIFFQYLLSKNYNGVLPYQTTFQEQKEEATS